MWDLAVREEAYPEIDAMLARFRGQPPLSLRLLPAFARGDSASVRNLLAEGRTLESRQLQIAARYAASYLENFGLADSLARLDLAWRERPANRAGAQLLLAGLAAAGGRWSAAREAFRMAETMEGAGNVIVHRAVVATLPLQPAPPEDLRAIRDAVERWDPSAGPAGSGLASELRPHLRLYLLGLLSSRMNDPGAAERAAALLDRLPSPAAGEAVGRSLAATVRADMAWMRDRPREVLQALDRGDHRVPLELIALSRAAHLREFGLEHGRFLRAAALSALGRESEALPWFRFGFRGSPQEYLYLPPVHVRMGELFERLGRPDSASAHYLRFLHLWNGADPGAAALLDDVRKRVTRLGGGAHP